MTSAADIRTSLAALRARPQCGSRVGAFGYCLHRRLTAMGVTESEIWLR